MGGRKLDRLVLEMSLKPFYSFEEGAIVAVCDAALAQWTDLLEQADSCSMLLWISDGTEIMEWKGDLDETLEWGRYIGYASEEECAPLAVGHKPKGPTVYREGTTEITYRQLATIVATLKDIAKQHYGVEMSVGATFDAGPEFAPSAFKTKKHPEINRAMLNGKELTLDSDYRVICVWSTLHEDAVSYAGFPQGIREGTSFGTFLGRQSQRFLEDLEFDYLWFSNGFAFSYFPWTYMGANYDGKGFGVDGEELSELVLGFWRDFRSGCPDFPIEVRGTNFGTGMDLAKDAVRLPDIYETGKVKLPPPNSPWGALNHDFGLEMTGYLSRIAELPDTTYPFRFYLNDPWFWQNPWHDCYDRLPHDIYCPMSAVRLNAQGEPETARVLEILSIDTERGTLDKTAATEASSHIKRMLELKPDRPGLLTWLYPYRELFEGDLHGEERSADAFFTDWFIRNAVNNGLPLNTVVSTTNFAGLEGEGWERLAADTILVVPAVLVTDDLAATLVRYVEGGGRALFYGPVRDAALMALLNLSPAEGWDGRYELDSLRPLRLKGSKLWHDPLVSAGPNANSAADAQDPYTEVLVEAVKWDERRAFALTRSKPEWQGGRATWMRGSLPFGTGKISHLPPDQPDGYADVSPIMLELLASFGYVFRQQGAGDTSQPAMQFASAVDGAYWFAGYKPDSTVRQTFGFPLGAPLFVGQSAVLGGGTATYALDRAFLQECRVYVNQSAVGAVRCREYPPIPTPKKRTERCIRIEGLIDAELVVIPPRGAAERTEFYQDAGFIEVVEHEADGTVRVASVTGTVDISW